MALPPTGTGGNATMDARGVGNIAAAPPPTTVFKADSDVLSGKPRPTRIVGNNMH